MVDLEGQDHGPSSSSVGDNDDDFIVYSKEDNATVAMECTEEVFLAKIIHGDGAKVIKVGEVAKPTQFTTRSFRRRAHIGQSSCNKVHSRYHSVNVVVQTRTWTLCSVVRDADKKGLSKIADEVKSFKQKAKENSLKPEDYEGGTFLCQMREELMGSSNSTPSSIPMSGILAVGSGN
ncbi:hypothetical protein Sjap_017970 [Stephania japonica]|uniref:2-oxoacid dehydrogenase acyltransferase catalytic domain-containing protein n=1 Tax=Stephania japonica TaxID=461633 RepID=A0AAP0I765_9MAGN